MTNEREAMTVTQQFDQPLPFNGHSVHASQPERQPRQFERLEFGLMPRHGCSAGDAGSAEALWHFAEELDDWLSRSPFLAIAFFLHLLAFFALNAVPWGAFEKEESVVVIATHHPPDDPFEPPDPDPIPEPVPLDPVPVEEVIIETIPVDE